MSLRAKLDLIYTLTLAVLALSSLKSLERKK
jgi:hypothetical protein